MSLLKLSCAPGVEPWTTSSRAISTIVACENRVISWYPDMKGKTSYLVGGSGATPSYHFTAPPLMKCAVCEARSIRAEDVLEIGGLATTVWLRHLEKDRRNLGWIAG